LIKAISRKLPALLLLGLFLLSPLWADRYSAQKYVEYGKTYFKQNDLTRAVQSLKYAARLDPTYDVPHAVMGDIYAYFKNYTEAKKEYLKALELNPKNYYYNYFLGLICLQEGNYNKAQSYLKSAIQLNPKHSDSYFNMALVYHKKGEIKKEETYLKNAVKLSPKNPKYLFALGQVFTREKKFLESMSSYERVIAMTKVADPFHAKARKELKQLKSGYQMLIVKEMLKKFIFGALALVIAVFLLLFIFRRGRASKELDDRFGEIYGETVPTVCEDLLAKLCQLTQMPFGVVYLISPTMDQLVPSIAANEDIANFKPLALDHAAIVQWQEKNKGQSFLFNTEKKTGLFLSSFPDIGEKLEALDIRVGLPGYVDNRLWCLVLLGSPRTKESARLRQIYEENKKLINKMGIKGAELLSGILQASYANLDPETGLFNRQAFDRQLTEEVSKSKNYNTPCSLMMMELDYHDQILSQLGEDGYRSIIRQVAQEVHEKLRASDFIARYAPGIFAAILPETEIRETTGMAEGIRRRIADLTLNEAYPKVTISIAAATHPFHALSQEDLIDMMMNTLGDLRMTQGNKISEVTRREKTTFQEKSLSKTRLSDDEEPPVFNPAEIRKPDVPIQRPKISLSDAPLPSEAPEPEISKQMDWHQAIPETPQEEPDAVEPAETVSPVGRPAFLTGAETPREIPEEEPVKFSTPPDPGMMKPFSPKIPTLESVSEKRDTSIPKIMRPFTPKITRSEGEPEKDEDSKAQPLRNQVWKKLTDTNGLPGVSGMSFPKAQSEEKAPEPPVAAEYQAACELPAQTPEPVEEISQPVFEPPVQPAQPAAHEALPAITREPAPEIPKVVVPQVKPELKRDLDTGFFLREGFEPYLEVEFSQAQEKNEPGALLVFSIDKVNQLEEKYGKPQVDNLLTEITGLIDTFLREGKDLPVVYEVNIFAVFLPKTSLKIAKNLAAQIIFTVGNSVFAEIIEKITLSIGIASFPEQANSGRELINKGLLALEEAIAQGGNQIKTGA